MARFITFLLLITAAMGGGWYLTREIPVAVAVHTVAKGPVVATVANTRVGTIKACRRAMLAPATGGQVASLPVTEGDQVERGQVLLEIWNEDLKARLKLAQAESSSAKARARESCAAYAGARREADRLTRLHKDQLVSEEHLDNAVTAADAKEAGCAASHAAAEVARAQIELARAQLERTVVRAPFNGTVAEVNAELEEYVTPSPPGIATLPAIDLINSSCLYVSAPIDEVDAPAIEIGMPACVSLDAFPEKKCGGVVRRIAPYVKEREKQARTVEVEVELTDPRDLAELLPGYSADIEVQLERKESVLRLPTEAVLEGDTVLVYDPVEQRLRRRSFEPGISNWDFTEIVSGITAGEQIVLSVGREGVSDGAYAVPDDSGERGKK